MTDSLITSSPDVAVQQQALFDNLVNRRGGVSALSALDIEICTMISAILVAARSVESGEMVRSADVIAKLLERLPPETDMPPADLTKLTDAQLHTLMHLDAIIHGEVEPDTPEPAPEPAPTPGPSEIAGARLGQWIDQHHGEWTHRQLNSIERDHLRSEYQAVARGFICRNLWFDIFRDQMHDEIERQIKAALADAGRDDMVTVAIPSVERPECVSIHDIPCAPLAPRNGNDWWSP